MKRLVAALLFVWEPLNFAAEALGVLPTLTYRGAVAAIELAVHALVAAVAAAGGVALWHGTSGARTLASVAVVAAVARVLQSLYWSVLPKGTVPGHETYAAAVAIAIGAFAIVVIQRQP